MAKNKKKEKEKQPKEPSSTKTTTAISIIALIIAALSLAFTIFWSIRMANIESYMHQLNFKIKWEQTDEDATIKMMPYEPSGHDLVEELPNLKFTVTATTGGIKAISVISYEMGNLVGNKKVDLSDSINQSKIKASDVMYACEVISLWPQLYGRKGDDWKYFTSLFVVVEGYNDDFYIVPTVFEYSADEDGQLLGGLEIREYNDFDILNIYNESVQKITDFDLQVLKDYVEIKEKLGI